ncbi:hypothetical protein PAPYR_7576 [Paratrimastix pyriformis]|uniref:Uncharacterized protein n=1 Tax=Paratrimastix pyriformis TaxID=342808 RepID=A0ABQ8UH83_9EUKA|nr:hypothetical protein PAPYR_7576 [Paratrimastix pyriformis]
MNFKPLPKSKQFALELFQGLCQRYYRLKDQLMTVYQNEIDEMDKIYNFYDNRFKITTPRFYPDSSTLIGKTKHDRISIKPHNIDLK